MLRRHTRPVAGRCQSRPGVRIAAGNRKAIPLSRKQFWRGFPSLGAIRVSRRRRRSLTLLIIVDCCTLRSIVCENIPASNVVADLPANLQLDDVFGFDVGMIGDELDALRAPRSRDAQ